MPLDYYDKVITLFKDIVDEEGITVPDILKLIEIGDNNANITRPWLYAVYHKEIKDPGIKRMDALYRVLRKKKQKLNRIK